MTTVSLGDVVAVCAARLGADASAVLARIGGNLGVDARAAHGADKQRRAEVMAVARVPASAAALRGVHPSWIEAALAQLPARARTALVSPRDGVDVWLGRRIAAELALVTVGWMPRGTAEVSAWLRRIALEDLAFALAERAAAVPGLREAAARVARQREGRGPQRDAVLRCRDARLDDEMSLVRVAARALAPHLAQEAHVCRAIARRLPREIGLELERVVVESSTVMVDRVPSWSLLVGA